MHGVMGTVVVPRIMSRALSSHCILCRGHCCCVATVGVIVPHFVSWALSLRGRGGCHVAWPRWVLLLHFVSWALSLHGHSGRCDMWPQWVSSCHVELWSGLLHSCSGCCHAMLCCGRNGCHTMWCRSCSCCAGGVVGIRVGVVRDCSD
jgi:hypothetical protein